MSEEQIVDETLDEGRNIGGEDEIPSMSPEKKRKIVLIALSGVTAISLMGGGAAVVILLTKGTGDGQPVRELDTSALRKPGIDDLPLYHEFPEQMVDIKSRGRRTRYVRIRMMAEVYFPENLARLQEVEPKILDGIQSYLRAQTAKQLSGRDGTEAMRDAFMQVARRVMGRENKIETILFKEILVQ